MRTRPMVQWAPGTRLQRIRRDDGTYRMEMEALNKRVDGYSRPVLKDKKKLKHKVGDLILLGGEHIGEVEEIDPEGSWVKVSNTKYGADYCRALPAWFIAAYNDMLKEVYTK